MNNKTKYDIEYRKKNIKQMVIDFNIEKDADIIEKLNNVPVKSQYIKRLIREDIKKESLK